MNLDDDAVGREQARQLRVTMAAADLDRPRLWLHYFALGGEAGDYEVDAYLHHLMMLSPLQRDLLAQAANEILMDLAPPLAPFAADVAESLRAGGSGRHDD